MAGPVSGPQGLPAQSRRRRRGLLALLLALSMVAVTACGSSTAGDSNQGQAGSSGSGTEQAQQVEPARADAKVVAADPTAVPEPVGKRPPKTVRIDLEAVELDGQLADGTTYTYWTFNGQVPGPMLRVRVGDTVELHLKNSPQSGQIHSIDLHAVNGPGGGAVATQVKPGEEKVFTWKALNPGLYIYHCASPHIPTHIANGMYGLILVEPEGGLPPVDKEFYIVQGEIYTDLKHGEKGHAGYDYEALLDEEPNYVVFNGASAYWTGERALKAKVGDRIRIFVGNGGPNLISSFHVIGEVFDAVHDQGATEAVHNVQTTLIPAGGAAWVEFTVDVPGTYTLVDHSISRSIDKGALAQIVVEGDPNPEVFDAPATSPDTH
ncbi:copper-containing nitrite reductase [Thermaerobacter composti]|uniref:Copper-containing nitrite reductase n=1 Tax=Thermaerobacter composti TaxID=554949 RepID=A0ABZ0QPD8_9FIRM|nr:copper-containing nitrite reductase [Thermaerobacter composti]WPD18273.1 copper-containing nitrite reductase [Thermaerobacter composti]